MEVDDEAGPAGTAAAAAEEEGAGAAAGASDGAVILDSPKSQSFTPPSAEQKTLAARMPRTHTHAL